MKIKEILALGLALVGLGRSLPNSEYPRAYLSDGQIWIQATVSEAPFRATDDCPLKSRPAVSLDRKRIAYSVVCVVDDRHVSPTDLVVLDTSGRELRRFATLSLRKLGGSCSPGGDLQWIDEHHIGINCSYNPSLENHLVVNAQTGEIEKEYLGIWFTWSPDRKTVAHVGQFTHFAPPIAQNFCLVFNDRMIYTPDCSNYALWDEDGHFRNIHTFGYPLLWSPDSHRIAFVEEVFDWAFDAAPNATQTGKASNERYYLVIASADEPVRGYKLPPSEYSRTPSLAWIGTSKIKLESKIYDVIQDRPEAIP